MLTRTFTAINKGLNTFRVEVELNTSLSKPGFIIIGLANRVVDESRERITAALQSCGVRIRPRKTVVNLAPADLKKTSSVVELAIAVALLKLYAEIKIQTDDTLFLGELALDGSLRKVNGILPIVLSAREMGFRKVFFPADNLPELSPIEGLKLYPLFSLQEYIFFAQGRATLNCFDGKRQFSDSKKVLLKLEDVFLQDRAKKALMISAAGGHNLLMIGPPGIGKTLLAKSYLSILPDLNEEELLEVNKIYSLAGLLNEGLRKTRPFRAPHHSLSQAALIGGGQNFQAGEVTLAHRGVLFLDELTEFKGRSIEALKSIISNKTVEINRVAGRVVYPANFTLLATANPCPCGFFASQKACSCSSYDLKRHNKKISGPILDRIDMTIRMNILENKNLLKKSELQKMTSAEVKNKVILAREIQKKRYQASVLNLNSDVESQLVKEIFSINRTAKNLLNQFSSKTKLSTRSYLKIIKLAQTIADLEASEQIQKKHLLEALNFRDLVF